MSIRDNADPHRVAHLTSAHGRRDIRIFHKQCRSLAEAGYDVTLVVADGKGDEACAERLSIRDVGAPKNRLGRMLTATRKVYKAARELDCDLYHLHDPELLPIGILLKAAGKRVVFDSHEDVPKQVFGKPYLPKPVQHIASTFIAGLERFAAGRFDAVVGATPTITEKFAAMGGKVANINNFPILGELERPQRNADRNTSVCYVGGISAERGILEMVQAIGIAGEHARLELAGEFSEREVRTKAMELPGWSKVIEHGFCDRNTVAELLSRSAVGLVTLAPTLNHIEALPIKMFEYMAAGIPVIASDFPLWRRIVDGARCGILVNPSDSSAIADAIDRFLNDPETAKAMGENGRQAVISTYNWGIDAPRLIALYRDVLR